jgi:hypothetical protein
MQSSDNKRSKLIKNHDRHVQKILKLTKMNDEQFLEHVLTLKTKKPHRGEDEEVKVSESGPFTINCIEDNIVYLNDKNDN